MLIGVEHEASFITSGPAFIDGLADTSTRNLRSALGVRMFLA